MERLIDTTAFLPATQEQIEELNKLAKALDITHYNTINTSWARGEAQQAIAIWNARLEERASNDNRRSY